MTILSAQSIFRLSQEEKGFRYIRNSRKATYAWPTYQIKSLGPLISPFSGSQIVNGKSFGLSACSYDCRIDQDLILTPMPWRELLEIINLIRFNNGQCKKADNVFDKITKGISNFKALASTIEHFAFPIDVCGSVLDKSTYARVFVSAFNTHLDPGWCGYLTVELVNLGDTEIVYKKGDSLCQIKFEWLDETTNLPYQGKYQNQPNNPVAAIFEERED